MSRRLRVGSPDPISRITTSKFIRDSSSFHKPRPSRRVGRPRCDRPDGIWRTAVPRGRDHEDGLNAVLEELEVDVRRAADAPRPAGRIHRGDPVCDSLPLRFVLRFPGDSARMFPPAPRRTVRGVRGEACSGRGFRAIRAGRPRGGSAATPRGSSTARRPPPPRERAVQPPVICLRSRLSPGPPGSAPYGCTSGRVLHRMCLTTSRRCRSTTPVSPLPVTATKDSERPSRGSPSPRHLVALGGGRPRGSKCR